MAYRTILPDLSAMGLWVAMARDLAIRFGAALVSMHAVTGPFVPAGLYGESSGSIAAELIAAQIGASREAAERVHTVFHGMCGDGPDRVWRRHGPHAPCRHAAGAVRPVI